jgi:hypothetical protein
MCTNHSKEKNMLDKAWWWIINICGLFKKYQTFETAHQLDVLARSGKLCCLVACFILSSFLPCHPAVISHCPRAICSCACRVCLAIFEMADIHEHECHVDGFFYIKCVVHHEFLCQEQTVNCWYYLKVLKHLREDARRKRPQLWWNNSQFLHHDNAPAHALLLIRDFLANMNTTVLPRPHYSPDLALVGFFLFPKLKSRISSDAWAGALSRRRNQEFLNNNEKTQRFGNWICFRPLVQWLRLALSKGPNRVGVFPHLRMETDPVFEKLCFFIVI